MTETIEEAKKTEGGIEYPASAYAYVPDKDQPSTWKLRLWQDPEQKITKSQLGRASAALSPGGFRGNRVEIPSDDLPAVKQKVRRAYKSLGVADEDIPRWVKESESRALVADYVPLAESSYDSTKGEVTLTIIKPGFNVSKQRYYPQEMLQRDYSIFEGVKMYADHPTPLDEKQRPERSVRDWVATLGTPWAEADGTIKAKAKVVETWLAEKLARLRDAGMLQDMGVSINAVGSASAATIEGYKTKLVERLIRARSVDFVTEAGAGGGVDLYESAVTDADVDLIDADQLKERRPDIVELIESQIRIETQKELKQMNEIETQLKEAQTQVETATKENTDLKAKLAELETGAKKAAAMAMLAESLVEVKDLPEAAMKRIRERFAGAVDITKEQIAEAVKAERDYITEIRGASKVKGMGPVKGDDQGITREALKESWKRLHPEWTDKQIEDACR